MEHASTRLTTGEPLPATPVKKTTPLGACIIASDRVIYRIANHWALAVNAFFATYVASLFLAPVLAGTGHHELAKPIYGFNHLFCHQRDDRSFHIMGHKMACCERCAAIYGAVLLMGLLFACLRGRLRAPLRYEAALLALPVVVDGGAQLFGLWESTAATRVLTGAMFGVAICWWFMPWLEGGFAKIRLQIETLFTRLVAEGRARPL